MSLADAVGEVKSFSAILMAIAIAILSWQTYTTYELSLNVASLTERVEYLVVGDFTNRVTTLETIVERQSEDIRELRNEIAQQP